MNKSNTFLIALLLTSLELFSQKIILDNKDTLICFNRNECKFLLTSYYKVKEKDSLLIYCKKKVVLRDSIISKQKSIIANKDQELIWKEKAVNEYSNKLMDTGNKLKKERRYKWIFILSTIILGTACIIK